MSTHEAARAITDYLGLYTLPANYTKPDNPHNSNWSVARRCGPLIAAHLRDLDLLTTAPSTATTDDAERIVYHESGDVVMSHLARAAMARNVVKALEDAGLLVTARPDTTTEWGVRWNPGGDEVDATPRTEEKARRLASLAPWTATTMRREVTPWIEADR